MVIVSDGRGGEPLGAIRVRKAVSQELLVPSVLSSCETFGSTHCGTLQLKGTQQNAIKFKFRDLNIDGKTNSK